jgi:hypothetical protein
LKFKLQSSSRTESGIDGIKSLPLPRHPAHTQYVEEIWNDIEAVSEPDSISEAMYEILAQIQKTLRSAEFRAEYEHQQSMSRFATPDLDLKEDTPPTSGDFESIDEDKVDVSSTTTPNSGTPLTSDENPMFPDHQLELAQKAVDFAKKLRVLHPQRAISSAVLRIKSRSQLREIYKKCCQDLTDFVSSCKVLLDSFKVPQSN